MSIVYDVLDCPLGKALVAATPLGICAVEFGDRGSLLERELGNHSTLRSRSPYTVMVAASQAGRSASDLMMWERST